jgi:hypothetical protein
MMPQSPPHADGLARGRAAEDERMDWAPPEIPVTTIATGIPALPVSRVGGLQLPLFVGSSAEDLAALLDRLDAGGCYTEVQIWMKGRCRLVEIPEDGLAQVQRRILGRLAQLELDLPGCVHGYVRGRSHISNATAHAGRRHLQKFDLKDFFPSVTRAAVVAVLGEAGFAPDVAERLGRLLTYRGRLPLGACTSPLLSNLCLRPLDAELQALAVRRGLVYTRYSDDLTFSGSEPFDVRAEVGAAVAAVGFRLNDDKTVTARYGQALYVTGLSVSDAAGPRLPKVFKRKLRQEMYLIQKFGLDSYAWRSEAATAAEEYGVPDYTSRTRRAVEGQLRYARAVEPAFVDKLAREFPGAYACVAKYPDSPRAIDLHEKALMAALDRRWSPPVGYQGTRHYSTGH